MKKEAPGNRGSSAVVAAPAGMVAPPPAASPLPLRRCISDAILARWSGQVEVRDEGESVGQVFFIKGMVAWAVYRYQQENLGKFLQRLGRITKDDLRRVSELHRRHGGQKKLGAILEEHGIMQAPVLRRCLMLHTRKALGLLLANPDAEGDFCSTCIPLDEKFVFYPEEVLPMTVSTELFKEAMKYQNEARRWRRLGKENAVLSPLTEIADYLASAIFTSAGEVVTAHVDPKLIDPYVLSVLMAGVVEASALAVQQGRIGMMQTLTIECSEGCLVARVIDDDLRLMAAVLLANDGNAGAAKVKLSRSITSLREWTAQYQTQLQHE